MVSPSAKRRAIKYIIEQGLGGNAQACRALRLARSISYLVRRVSAENQRLRKEIVKLSRDHPRYGYRRITALLRRAGSIVNPKRVRRIRTEEGFKVSKRQNKMKRIGSSTATRQKATHQNHVWSYDFVADQVENGTNIRFLTLIDEYTRECHTIHAAWSIPATAVITLVQAAMKKHGIPEHIRSDNGPEFIAYALQDWLKAKEVNTLYIEPGSPWENGHIESFHGKLRDEFLNRELFGSLTEAKVLAEAHRIEYNQQRPHSSLDYQTPQEYARRCQTPLRPTASTPSDSSNRHINQGPILHF
jgi:putative transposase